MASNDFLDWIFRKHQKMVQEKIDALNAEIAALKAELESLRGGFVVDDDSRIDEPVPFTIVKRSNGDEL